MMVLAHSNSSSSGCHSEIQGAITDDLDRLARCQRLVAGLGFAPRSLLASFRILHAALADFESLVAEAVSYAPLPGLSPRQADGSE